MISYLSEAAPKIGRLAPTMIGNDTVIIERLDQPSGCDKCRALGTVGFISKPHEFGLSDVRHVRKIYDDSEFCDCEYGESLRLSCMERLKISEQDIAKEAARVAIIREADRLFPKWSLPEDMGDFTMNTWSSKFGNDPAKQLAIRAARELLAQGRIRTANGSWNGILWHGVAGVGKTGLMVSALRDRMEAGRPALFITMNDILLLTNWIDDKQMIKDRIKMLSSIPILGIDELGMPGQNITDHERTRIIFPILDSRYKKKLPTLATSNWTLDEIKEKLGQALYERLFMLCAPVQVGGSSGRPVATSAYGEQK